MGDHVTPEEAETLQSLQPVGTMLIIATGEVWTKVSPWQWVAMRPRSTPRKLNSVSVVYGFRALNNHGIAWWLY